MEKKFFQDSLQQVEHKLFGFAMKLTKNEQGANDLFQETVYKAYANIDKFRKGSNFKAWITTIMYNTYVNQYRKRKRRKQVEAPVEDFSYALESEVYDQTADGKIMEDDLKEILNGLSGTYKKPLKMYVDGYKYKEISSRLDIPMGTVKSRINYARTILKEKIRGLYGQHFRRKRK